MVGTCMEELSNRRCVVETGMEKPCNGGHEVRAGMENSCSGWETEGELCVDKQDMIMGSTGRMRGRSNVTV